MTGQPRAIVFHEKLGRRHAHCVWSRIDAEQRKGINLPHFKRKLTAIPRSLYQEHGWDMPLGLQDAQKRDPLNYSHAEASQAKRAKCDPKELKALFRSCWDMSDSLVAFRAALSDQGFALARGDRRGFVAVDVTGEVYSLSRWCGVKPKELRARLGSEEQLPSIEEAQARLDAQVFEHPDASLDKALSEHQARLDELVARQRAERQELQDHQAVRKTAELQAAQASLPTGFAAAWSRLTGQYQSKLKALEAEAKRRDTLDRRETEGVIERHLSERRELDQQLDLINAQHALEAEARSFERRTAKRYAPDPRQPLILPRERPAFSVGQLRRNPSLILEHISQREASFTRNDIAGALSEFLDDPLDLQFAIDTALRSNELVSLEADSEQRFTTRSFQQVERKLSSTSSEMARLGRFKVSKLSAARAIVRENKRLKRSVGAALSDEQVAAIEHVLGANQLSAVVGLAGTGKSTLLSVARDAWERQGYTVHGAALAGKAADSLESASDIPSRTLASLETSWENGYEPIGCGDIVVIDEAGVVGTRQLNRVMARLNALGCKIVLVGDLEQLQPIEAGEPFRDIVKSAGAAKLTDIRRQRHAWQRAASKDLAQGFTEVALQAYADEEAVHHYETADDAIASLVSDYMEDLKKHGPNRSRLALAHRHKDVYAINQAIRQATKELEGAVPELLVETDMGPRVFAEGDRILFTRNDKELGVRNGMLGTVTGIDSNRVSAKIDCDDHESQKSITTPRSRFRHIDHGYAVTIHRAQGCTVDRSFVLSSSTMDENLIYVAMTRHREISQFYSSSRKTVQSKTEPATSPSVKRHRSR
ncbi:MAG: AAA family ATPase [Rhizobiales bacterium]|nr:AAA family ATPase [Hyphomicrobiales bacterium]MBO6736572.1 AAA family ATPase [Hyphomicrobiales bacterium]MBO6912354.1 AAA family ATPase [Hyphomicrobiales bacterium]